MVIMVVHNHDHYTVVSTYVWTSEQILARYTQMYNSYDLCIVLKNTAGRSEVISG